MSLKFWDRMQDLLFRLVELQSEHRSMLRLINRVANSPRGFARTDCQRWLLKRKKRLKRKAKQWTEQK